MSVTLDPFDTRMVFLRIGWMNHYEGVTLTDEIVGGGEYVKQHGFGFEAFNFLPYQGSYYGYVMPGKSNIGEPAGHIRIDRIDPSAKNQDSLSGVLIVWVATHPQGNACVVGWYSNATLFRRWQPSLNTSHGPYNGDPVGYFATAKVEESCLLPIDERVLFFSQGGAGSFGQRNLWYADDRENATHCEVREAVLKLVAAAKVSTKPFPKAPAIQPDVFTRQAVEKKAVEVVWAHYDQLGYDVESVESDNVGWDLTAKLKKVSLRLEVKGLSGDALCVEVTPNEYSHMKEFQDSYRLCVVRSALKSPKLDIFVFNNESGYWENQKQERLVLEERVAARCRLA
jgi:hypothetical protein